MTSTPGSPADPNGPQGAPAAYGMPAQTNQAGAPAPTAGGPEQTDPNAGRFGQPEQQSPPAGFDDRGRVRRGRISATWIGIIAATIVLILLIVFIAQNLNKPTIHFLGASGRFPLGLLVLLSAIAGVIIAVIPGTIRILQLRKALKKNTPPDQRRHDKQG